MAIFAAALEDSSESIVFSINISLILTFERPACGLAVDFDESALVPIITWLLLLL